MGCRELTERDYYRLRNCTKKTAYSRFFFTVTDDQIGNRKTYDTTESGSNAQSVYTANNLNQYTQISKGNPPVVALPTHDEDGNMLTMALASGEWSTTYNGENRLIIAESATQRLEFSYDYKGRRVEKKVYSGTPGSWTLDEHSRFVYDGYLQIEKLDALNSNAVVRKRIWSDGKVICDIHGSTPYYALGDANKNITEYLDATGAIAAHFEYSPFGKITVPSGTDPDDFDFRFSSEYFDTETELVYYNFRLYSPELGRWLRRDPIQERGGMNLYGMVGNSPTITIDKLGLEGVSLIVTRSSTHGSVEAKAGGGKDINLYIVYDETINPRGHYPKLSPYASIRMLEASGDWWWSARLDAKLRFPKPTPAKFEGRYFQLSTDYYWNLQIKGCCKSGTALLTIESSHSEATTDTPPGSGIGSSSNVTDSNTILKPISKTSVVTIPAGSVTMGAGISMNSKSAITNAHHWANLIVSVACQ